MDIPSHHFIQHLTGRTSQCSKTRKRGKEVIITVKEILKMSLFTGSMIGHTENSNKFTQLELVIKFGTDAGHKINRDVKKKKKSTLVVKPQYAIDNLKWGPTAFSRAHKVTRYLFACFMLYFVLLFAWRIGRMGLSTRGSGEKEMFGLGTCQVQECLLDIKLATCVQDLEFRRDPPNLNSISKWLVFKDNQNPVKLLRRGEHTGGGGMEVSLSCASI